MKLFDQASYHLIIFEWFCLSMWERRNGSVQYKVQTNKDLMCKVKYDSRFTGLHGSDTHVECLSYKHAEITEMIGKVFCSFDKIRSISVILTVLNIKVVKRVKAWKPFWAEDFPSRFLFCRSFVLVLCLYLWLLGLQTCEISAIYWAWNVA